MVKLFTVVVAVGLIHIFYTNYQILMTTEDNSEPLSYLNISKQFTFDQYLTFTNLLVLPRAAFFDGREREKHKNATVVLASIHKSMIGKGLIKACVIGNREIRTIKVQPLIANRWIHRLHPECTYNNTLIFCFDSPPCENGTKVEIIYRDPIIEEYTRIESEYAMYMPEPRRRRTLKSPSVIACATVFGSPPYFEQWIRYQKSIGVEMVYLNAQESFVASAVFNDSFLQESISNGFVTYTVWKEYLGNKVFYHNQALYYNNCLYRFQGVFDYALMFDSDDFFYSSSREAHISDVMQELFSNNETGSVKMQWRRYYDPHPDGFNLTDIDSFVNISAGIHETNVKSIHKLSVGVEIRIHAVVEMLDGFEEKDADPDIALVAHIKNPLKMNVSDV